MHTSLIYWKVFSYLPVNIKSPAAFIAGHYTVYINVYLLTVLSNMLHI